MTSAERASSYQTLAGARLTFVADASPEMLALGRALTTHGATVERVHTDAWWWVGESRPDAAIVRIEERPAASPQQRASEQHRLDLLQSIVQSERVIGLLDESLLGALPGLRDFVLPPFRPSEVIVRVARVLHEPRSSALLRVGNLELHVANRTVTIGGQPVDLTFHEFEILHALLAVRGNVLSREELNRLVWPEQPANPSRRMDIHIHRLRSKLRSLNGASIDTVRNVGYRLGAEAREP